MADLNSLNPLGKLPTGTNLVGVENKPQPVDEDKTIDITEDSNDDLLSQLGIDQTEEESTKEEVSMSQDGMKITASQGDKVITADISGFQESIERRLVSMTERAIDIKKEIEEGELDKEASNGSEANDSEDVNDPQDDSNVESFDDYKILTGEDIPDADLDDLEMEIDDNDDDVEDIEKEIEDDDFEERKREAVNRFIIELDSKSGINDIPDISKMPILTRGIRASEAARSLADQTNQSRKWPLLECGKVVILRGLNAAELDKISVIIDENADNNSLTEALSVIHDAIKNENKPDFVKWMKNTLVGDLYNYINGLYYATFDGSNYVRVDCEGTEKDGKKCPGTYLSEAFDILKSVKHANDKSEDRFNEVMKKNDQDLSTPITSKLAAISSRYAVKIVKQSIYGALIEPKIIGNSIIKKYGAWVGMIQLIESFYKISPEGLVPVKYKVDEKSSVKTARFKIAEYYKLLCSVSSDEYSKLYAIETEIMESDVEYEQPQFVVPEQKCPHCGTVAPAQPIPGILLLLGRHRLRLTRA